MKIIVNNQLIEYKDEGLGRQILLLHGWGTNLSTFNQLAEHLAKSFRVIRLDFPGFGGSPKPADDWSVSNYAQMTHDFLQKINAEDLFAVVAHSFGGRVTIKGISQGYLKPQKVILIGAAGIKPAMTAKKIVLKTIAKFGKVATSLPVINKVQPKLRQHLYSVAGNTDYLQTSDMRQIFLNTVNEDLLPEVKNIIQPVKLIWGENDAETPLKDAHKMLAKLKNGQLVVIEGAGHFVHIDAFDRVAKELDNFLL